MANKSQTQWHPFLFGLNRRDGQLLDVFVQLRRVLILFATLSSRLRLRVRPFGTLGLSPYVHIAIDFFLFSTCPSYFVLLFVFFFRTCSLFIKILDVFKSTILPCKVL